MSHFLSSFPIDVPDIPAKIYEVSASLPDDPYSELSHFENILSDRTRGRAHRIRGPDGNWYLAVFGHETEPDEVDVDGVTLSLAYQTTLTGEKPRERNPLSQALREALSSYLTSVVGWWEYNEYGNFYEPDPVRTIQGDDAKYEMYPGVRTSINYRDGSGFMLSFDPTRKFIDELTLAMRLEEDGDDEVLSQFGSGKRFFFFDRPAPQPVRLQTVTDSTVSEETMKINGEPKSVLTFVEEEYGSEFAGKIDPTEPVVKVKYSPNGRPYDAAPSLLRLIPDQEEATTQASTLDASERWQETEEWIRPIHYIQFGPHKADIVAEPISEGIDVFEFPSLRFGGDAVLSVGDTDLTGSGTVSREDWEYRVWDYLEEFGPRERLMDEPWVAVLHSNSARETAFDAFEDIRGYVSKYAHIDLRRRPGGACFEDRSEFTEWQEQYADEITGAFAYMAGRSDTQYYDVINAINGKAVQHIRHENYQAERGRTHSYSLRNVATDLASKLGVRPFLLENGLHADAVIGLSVTGDQQTTACAVTVSGATGNVIDWTDHAHGRGKSTVTDHDLAERLFGDGVVAANAHLGEPVESVVVHRNGTYGNEEIAGIKSAIEGLKSEGYIEEDFNWSAVELRDSTSYRIYSDGRGRACQTGAYARIDDSTILLAPSGRAYTHQGTPRTFQVRVKAGSDDLDITDIGKDIFDLTFLAWWSPGSKISDPITTRYPSRMHSLFEKCPQLQFLPS